MSVQGPRRHRVSARTTAVAQGAQTSCLRLLQLLMPHVPRRGTSPSSASVRAPFQADVPPSGHFISTVNLSVFRRRPHGASAMGSACKIGMISRCEQVFGTAHGSRPAEECEDEPEDLDDRRSLVHAVGRSCRAEWRAERGGRYPTTRPAHDATAADALVALRSFALKPCGRIRVPPAARLFWVVVLSPSSAPSRFASRPSPWWFSSRASWSRHLAHRRPG